jgi:hypothetical protein
VLHVVGEERTKATSAAVVTAESWTVSMPGSRSQVKKPPRGTVHVASAGMCRRNAASIASPRDR